MPKKQKLEKKLDLLKVKLGKKAPLADPRNFQFGSFTQVTVPVPEPPAEVSWIVKVPEPWNVLLNNSLGDCVPAAMAHTLQQVSFFAGNPVIPTDDQVLTMYEKIGGYVPGDPATDNGAFMLDALKYWRNTGVAGHKILAFVQVDPLNLHQVRQAIYLFGSVFAGLQLPISAQGQDIWTVPQGGAYLDGSPGSWGGHCVPIMAMSPESLTCVTWGQKLKMSHNFLRDYCDELYAVVSSDWMNKAGLSPGGFNLQQLENDLRGLS